MTTRSFFPFGRLLIASCFIVPALCFAAPKAPSVTVNQAIKSVAAKTPAVSLIATAVDTDGKITSYSWKQTGGPSVTLSDIYTDWASFTAPSTQTPIQLTFEVTVTDTNHLTAKATATVNVQPSVNGAVASISQ